jgi:DNA-binding NtrC family response regulator
VRASLAHTLERARFSVVTAATAIEARQYLDAAAVDVVVSDAIMPGGMTGLELVAWLEQARPGLPVVLMSGYSDDAFGGGAPAGVQLLRKPFTAATLLEHVAAVRVRSDGTLARAELTVR